MEIFHFVRFILTWELQAGHEVKIYPVLIPGILHHIVSFERDDSVRTMGMSHRSVEVILDALFTHGETIAPNLRERNALVHKTTCRALHNGTPSF